MTSKNGSKKVFLGALAAMLAWSAPDARAAEVLQVVEEGSAALVSPKEVGTWKENDEVCALREAREIACGKVLRVVPQGAIVGFDGPQSGLRKGDLILLVGDKRPTAGAPLIDPSMRYVRTPFFQLGVGLALNFDYVRWVGNVMVATSKFSAIGFHGSYAHEEDIGDPQFKATTALATLNFFNRRGLEGLWAQLGAGYEFFRLEKNGVVESGRVPTALGAFGWRSRINRTFSFGVIAGIQYVAKRRAGTLSVADDRFNPYLQGDIAFRF